MHRACGLEFLRCMPTVTTKERVAHVSRPQCSETESGLCEDAMAAAVRACVEYVPVYLRIQRFREGFPRRSIGAGSENFTIVPDRRGEHFGVAVLSMMPVVPVALANSVLRLSNSLIVPSASMGLFSLGLPGFDPGLSLLLF